MGGWALAAGVGADIIGGVLGGNASDKATSAQTKATNKANALAYQQWLQDRQDQMPYRYVGNQALNVLAKTQGLDPYSGQQAAQTYTNAMAGMSKKQQKAMNKVIKTLGYNPLTQSSGGSYDAANPGAHQAGHSGTVGGPQTVNVLTDPTAPDAVKGNYDAFMASPDYNFRKDQGQDAITRYAAARGMRLSGGALKDTANFNSGLAAGEYGNWWNRLSALAGNAQTATNNVQNSGNAYSNSVQGNTTAAGDARASGYMNKAGTWNNAIAGAGGAIGTYLGNRKSKPKFDYYGDSVNGVG